MWNILIVDDEEMVLETVTRMLERLGYSVLEAGSGMAAIDVYKEKMKKIDLIILDMIMPKMDAIEDTDRERSSDEMTGQILEAMAWLGLDVDEPPVHQADGLERHRADVRRLLDAGLAYRCFASKEELDELRAKAREDVVPFRYRAYPEYDAADAERRAAAGEPHAVFFEVPPGEITFDDAVHGPTTVPGDSLDDFVILRSDGTPVYNLAVVSDDIDMGITHVIRGDDHINNTPRQINIYRALCAELPEFAHVPMILGDDGARLSKRHGAVGVMQYRDDGYLPQALLNYLVRLI